MFTLVKTTHKSKKRLGRGYGSGKGGHTVGRGAKGFKARSRVSVAFIGTKSKKSWIKRLPLWRGKTKQKSFQETIIFSLSQLEKTFPDKAKITPAKLLEKFNLQPQRLQKLKILNRGNLKKSFTVSVPCSVTAAKKIKKAGGQIIPPKPNTKSN